MTDTGFGASGNVALLVGAGKAGGRLVVWASPSVREEALLQTLQGPRAGRSYYKHVAHGCTTVTGVRVCGHMALGGGEEEEEEEGLLLYSCGMDGKLKLWRPSREGFELKQAGLPAGVALF